MDRERLLELLRAVASGETGPEDALSRLADFPVADMGFARLDSQRHLRRGLPETVYAEGKTPEQLEEIVRRVTGKGSPLLLTRVPSPAAERLLSTGIGMEHDPLARTVSCGALPPRGGKALVVAAGTSDLPVAREALNTLRFLGREGVLQCDVGVAGLHRLAALKEQLEGAGVVIAVAGMEGALPGVLAGLLPLPVIGVPTSVGYGVSLQGLTPLFTMLSSCACGLTVVNIDNGYGAAVAAHLVLGREGE